MNPDYWLNRWKNNDAPWHMQSPEPLLVRYIPSREKQSVLVPLCGKSVDMLWLKENGHHVFGIELSDSACHSFFTDANLEYKTRSTGKFEIFESAQIKIWCGDLFEIPVEEFPKIDLIYDRAALIALPPDLRIRYAKRISTIATKSPSRNFEMLVILREGIDSTEIGPPFDVSSEELESLYGSIFKISLLETMTRPSRRDPKLKAVDSVYRLMIR